MRCVVTSSICADKTEILDIVKKERGVFKLKLMRLFQFYISNLSNSMYIKKYINRDFIVFSNSDF